MLGLRGVRLGIVIPGLFTMQARAILEAAADRIAAGGDPQPGDHDPAGRDACASSTWSESGSSTVAARGRGGARRRRSPHKVGTMIELPRAALTADSIAGSAEFFSFGTNDLTQMTWGFSRDDVEASFFGTYLEHGIFPVSPFESLDTEGVGALVRDAAERGRRDQARPAPRRLRRARRRPGLDPLLRRGRARLRLLLAVPGAGRPAGGRPRVARRGWRGRRGPSVRTARRPGSWRPAQHPGSSLPTAPKRPSRCSRAWLRSSPVVRRTSVDQPVERVLDVPAEHVEVGDQGLRVDVVGVRRPRPRGPARGRRPGCAAAPWPSPARRRPRRRQGWRRRASGTPRPPASMSPSPSASWAAA